jgi:thiol-disulfide isomerase/thioredoxin
MLRFSRYSLLSAVVLVTVVAAACGRGEPPIQEESSVVYADTVAPVDSTLAPAAEDATPLVPEARIYNFKVKEDRAAYTRYVAKGIVVFKVGTTGCPPCKAMNANVLPKLAKESDGKYMVMNVEVDELDEATAALLEPLDVQAYPTTLLFYQGVSAKRYLGMTSVLKFEDDLAALINDGKLPEPTP